MAAMPSKQVTDREKSARKVIASGQTHAQEIHAQLQTKLQSFLERGEDFPNIKLFIELIGRSLSSVNDKLVVADRSHEQELADDAAPRSERDKQQTALAGVLSELRSLVQTIHSTEGMSVLRLDQPIPKDASALAQYAESVHARLTDPKVKLTGKRRGTKLDREEFAQEITEHLPKLKKALADVAREAREAEGTLTSKHQAMEANDAAFSATSNLLAALYHYADRTELAERVRPSSRKPGQLEEEPDDSEPKPPVT